METLTSITNTVKSVFEAKTNEIVSKANTIIEKVKSQTEIVKSTLKKPNISPRTEARFHVTVRSQINKFEFYFTVRRNVKFWCSDANSCTKFDVKSGLRVTNQMSVAKIAMIN